MKLPILTPLSFHNSTKGMTLVELMIVVAVVGVLAAIASVSYSKYVVAGKVTELKQQAMDVARGQEQYFSRNQQYYQPDDAYDSDSTGSDPQWNQLLEFNAQVPATRTLRIEAGTTGETCGLCPTGVGPTQDGPWFVVEVADTDIQKLVYFSNELNSPVEMDE